MDIRHAHFARPIPRSDEAAVAVTSQLADYTYYPEAFADAASRDAALGPWGRSTVFIPTTWSDAEMAGFSIASVAVGHSIDDPRFSAIAEPVIEAVVAQMIEHESFRGRIVIARALYEFHVRDDRHFEVVGGCETFGAPVDAALSDRTLDWLHRELADRIGALVG